ncbi:MAG: TolC family protein, partial [Caldilineaceae bacterium]|nr:TolC family protein [Caldilineaceae bacterium]
MSTQQGTFSGAAKLLPRTLVALAVTAVMAGCTVAPKAITADEVRDRVKSDTAKMYADQAPITAPITMEEAVARALKYNLDYRLKKMESALAMGLTDYASYDMLPQMVASAGYRHRSNDSGGVSIGILDGELADRPTTSDERSRTLRGIEFSWNVLDFGVSYYRARQQGDQFLIAEERRRKVVQNLLQDVRAAYWRALGAQRLNAQADDILQRASVALNRSREAETQKIIPPGLALAYQRALLDATTLLNQRRQDLEFAKRELAALMNVPPGVDFQVAEANETSLPATPRDITKLEEMALLQRPELREEDFRKRITADEARKQILSMLPGISFNYGRKYDSNVYTFNNNWSEGGVSLAWNLMRLVALPSLKDAQKYQEATDEARRMALSMAILTQTRVSAERYKMALEDFRLADQASQVDTRLAAFTKASVSAK